VRRSFRRGKYSKICLLAPHDTGARVGLARQAAQRQVLGHRHAGEEAAALRHIADAQPRDVGRGQAGEVAALELDASPRPAAEAR
jgi:hypothetical protein